MPPGPASAPAPKRRAHPGLAEHYSAQLGCAGRARDDYMSAARKFLLRWPYPQSWADEPLEYRLGEGPYVRPFLLFLMLQGYLHPGYDYLVSRKLVNFWREAAAGPLGPDLESFCLGAQAIGYTPAMSVRVASQSVGRMLVQTGRHLEELALADFEELARACAEREAGRWGHYRSAMSAAQRVLFHLGIVDELPPAWEKPKSFEERMAAVRRPLRPSFVAYLERKAATCHAKTVTGLATRLAHFGQFLGQVDPKLRSLRALERRRHIEPYLNFLTTTPNSKSGGTITRSEQARRAVAVRGFLADIAEWGWDEAPSRKLIFRTDIPRAPRPLPRYLPVDADRRLSAALERSPYRLAADALLLQRCCGLRIGELLDLELDCVHELEGNGAWLKVPLGKLDTERMMPLDDETVALVDRIVAHAPMAARSHTHARGALSSSCYSPRPPSRPTSSANRTRPRCRRRWPGACNQPPTKAHLRYGHGQRRCLTTGANGPARPRLSRDELALWPVVRLDGQGRVRAGARARQGPDRHAAGRTQADSGQLGELAGGPVHKGPACRWLLLASPGPGCLPLRQHL